MMMMCNQELHLRCIVMIILMKLRALCHACLFKIDDPESVCVCVCVKGLATKAVHDGIGYLTLHANFVAGFMSIISFN